MSGFAFQGTAYAEQGMTLSVNAAAGSTTISVSGYSAVSNNDITITVRAPNGNIVSIGQISPSSGGDYMTAIQVGGQQWKQDGMYTITVQQGNSIFYNLDVSVQIASGTTLETSVSESTLEDSSIFDFPTYPEETFGLTLVADIVPGSTTIGISGTTDRSNTAVTLTITAPNGNIVAIDQLMPNAGGDFTLDIGIGGSQWNQNGMYTITAQQGDRSSVYRDSVQVEVVDGFVIPEFGTIAALILAVAIISIIAVTAKTRLSLIPRY